MICYLDASALVKRYVQEPATDLVDELVAGPHALGTAAMARVEVNAALSKAVRARALSARDGLRSRQAFARDWPQIVSLDATSPTLDRAVQLAWSHGLRGYDAVHLATACSWQDALGERLQMVTFDLRLWEAAAQEGLLAYPPDLPALLDSWSAR